MSNVLLHTPGGVRVWPSLASEPLLRSSTHAIPTLMPPCAAGGRALLAVATPLEWALGASAAMSGPYGALAHSRMGATAQGGH